MSGCSAYAIASLLVERAQAELATARAGVPARVGVMPDRPPFEFCAQLFAVVTGSNPKPSKGGQGATLAACGHEWRIAVTLGVYRCDRSINPQRPQEPPNVVALDSATRDLLDDSEALRRAILNANWDAVELDRSQVTFGPSRIVGRAGGAYGVEYDLLVDTELGRMSDEAVPMLPTDPRTPTGG